MYYSENVDIKYVGGADPEMVFINASDEEVEVYIYLLCALFHVMHAWCYTYVHGVMWIIMSVCCWYLLALRIL